MRFDRGTRGGPHSRELFMVHQALTYLVRKVLPPREAHGIEAILSTFGLDYSFYGIELLLSVRHPRYTLYEVKKSG
jgi:hypothetical protein